MRMKKEKEKNDAVLARGGPVKEGGREALSEQLREADKSDERMRLFARLYISFARFANPSGRSEEVS